MILLLWILTLGYVLLMLYLLFGLTKLPDKKEDSAEPFTSFSIVVPYRNEAENLPQLFASLTKLDYPASLFEIILVNDASEDHSQQLCRDFKVNHPHLSVTALESLRSSNSPKKDAVNTGIEAATHDFILTTDADCEVPEAWLKSMNTQITATGAEMICGPVAIKRTNTSFLQKFQELDFLSLQAATMGGFGMDSPFLCNAANFCYRKQAFLEEEGFTGNNHIASGDDLFLLEKFTRSNRNIAFLNDQQAIVTTLAQPSLKDLISQRIRWAAKTTAYKNKMGKFTGATVLLTNAALVVAFVLFLFGRFPQHTFFLCFLLKFNVDFLLMHRSASIFKREGAMTNYFWGSFIYPFFSSFVGLLSLISPYNWKGRQFKK